MSKRAFVPSNDNMPKDELFLAKLIQNASARGLRSCRYMRFQNANGLHTDLVQDAVACCAIGCADLEDDTDEARGLWPGMVDGNDNSLWTAYSATDYGQSSGESIGWAFMEALADG